MQTRKVHTHSITGASAIANAIGRFSSTSASTVGIPSSPLHEAMVFVISLPTKDT
eukprot:CCRYP_008730-RA/>CCRYP_008730-RA protein AED:0.00 eAED:0.00 QI:79/1/1/1/0/0/2/5/54